MRLFPAELALLNIQGKASKDDPEYLPPDVAWQWLRDIVACGDAPDDLGEDVEKWAAWVDHEYTRRHRVACDTASFRLEGPATVKGKYINQGGRRGFAQVVLSVAPVADNSPPVIDTSHCVVPYAYQPDESVKENYLASITDGIQEYATRNRLVGINVSILEIHVHEHDSNSFCFKIAAGRAMHEAVVTAGKVAV